MTRIASGSAMLDKLSGKSSRTIPDNTIFEIIADCVSHLAESNIVFAFYNPFIKVHLLEALLDVEAVIHPGIKGVLQILVYDFGVSHLLQCEFDNAQKVSGDMLTSLLACAERDQEAYAVRAVPRYFSSWWFAASGWVISMHRNHLISG